MKNNKNNNQEPNNIQYMPIGMCIGISVGMAIGSALGNIAIGMCIGLSIGMSVGVVIDSMNRKKSDGNFDTDKNDEENGKPDWKFDFENLPHWDNRNTIPYVFDDFHHIPQSDTLCCIYSIAEVGMCRYMGFLAILKNKEKPELILNVADKMNFYRNFFVNQKGDIIFLQPFIYNKETKMSSCPIMIIDTENRKFAYYNADNYRLCYKISELSDHIFTIEANESQKSEESHKTPPKTEIDLRCLDWCDFSKI